MPARPSLAPPGGGRLILINPVVTMCVGAALYGAVLGSWRGGAMVWFDALKLPLVLLTTAALTLSFQWLLAQMLGLRIGFAQVGALAFSALAATAVVLASVAPIAWLFTVAAPPPGPAARTTHNLLYLMHTALVAGAGWAGTIVLWRGLCTFDADRARCRRVYIGWLLAFALVGGEVAWAFRPFVGSIYLPVDFLRADALDGTVYELIVTDILPHLLDR